MAVLDIQRRGQQIGRIRIGQLVRTDKGKMRPEKLDTFRFTTASRTSAEAIAVLYGGQVREWEGGGYEVITAKSDIGVTVPPRDQVISQWYEMWTKGGCQRRCTSQHEQISNGPCLCPHATNPDDEAEVAAKGAERSRLASLNPPQACKLVTRISVMIPDLPGLGIFRLDTGSYYAATEIGDSAALMQTARDKGIFLPAVLRIEQRSRVANGQTKKYPVPVLEILATFRQIATGELEAAGITAQLPPPPAEAPKAITAAPAQQAAAADAPGEEGWQRAQRIYHRALDADSPAELTACGKELDSEGLADEQVCTDTEHDVWEPAMEAWRALWRERARGIA
jgi:Recombination directionality factor-like